MSTQVLRPAMLIRYLEPNKPTVKHIKVSFHQWGVNSKGHTAAIVEFDNGIVELAEPECIRFLSERELLSLAHK